MRHAYRVFVHNRELRRALQLDELHLAAHEVRRDDLIELADGRRVIVEKVDQPAGGRPGRIEGRPYLQP